MAKETVKFGNFMEQAYGFSQAVKVGGTDPRGGPDRIRRRAASSGSATWPPRCARRTPRSAGCSAEFGATHADIVDETLYVTDPMAAAMASLEVRGEVYGPDFAGRELVDRRAGPRRAPELMIEIKCTAQV